AAGRLPVSGQENAVVPPPELVLGQPVPLGALLDEEDEIGRAFLDLEVLRLDNGGHGIPAFPELRAVHPVAVVHQDQGAHDGPSAPGPDGPLRWWKRTFGSARIGIARVGSLRRWAAVITTSATPTSFFSTALVFRGRVMGTL